MINKMFDNKELYENDNFLVESQAIEQLCVCKNAKSCFLMPLIYNFKNDFIF